MDKAPLLTDNEIKLAWNEGVDHYQKITISRKQNDYDRFFVSTKFAVKAQRDASDAHWKDRIADLKADRLTYCAYCGEDFPIDAGGTPKAVSEHIHNCPKHPIQDYKAEIEQLQARIAEAVKAYKEFIEWIRDVELVGQDDWGLHCEAKFKALTSGTQEGEG